MHVRTVKIYTCMWFAKAKGKNVYELYCSIKNKKILWCLLKYVSSCKLRFSPEMQKIIFDELIKQGT